MFGKLINFCFRVIIAGIISWIIAFVFVLLFGIVGNFAVAFLGIITGDTIEAWLSGIVNWGYWFNVVYGVSFITMMLKSYGLLPGAKTSSFSFTLKVGADKPNDT